MSATQTTTARTIECVIPILRVEDLEASLKYYIDTLGFRQDWCVPGSMASVSRDRRSLMLCEGDQGNRGTWVWIGVQDITPLFEEYVAKGAKIRHPPTNYQWAYEMQIEDPDGHVLRFGSDSKPDQPIGEWLDGRGDIWVMSSETGKGVRKEPR